MEQFKFNEEDSTVLNTRRQRSGSGFSQKLIKWGLAKNEKQANLYLLLLVIVMFGLIIYLNFRTFYTSSSTTIIEDPSLSI